MATVIDKSVAELPPDSDESEGGLEQKEGAPTVEEAIDSASDTRGKVRAGVLKTVKDVLNGLFPRKEAPVNDLTEIQKRTESELNSLTDRTEEIVDDVKRGNIRTTEDGEGKIADAIIEARREAALFEYGHHLGDTQKNELPEVSEKNENRARHTAARVEYSHIASAEPSKKELRQQEKQERLSAKAELVAAKKEISATIEQATKVLSGMKEMKSNLQERIAALRSSDPSLRQQLDALYTQLDKGAHSPMVEADTQKGYLKDFRKFLSKYGDPRAQVEHIVSQLQKSNTRINMARDAFVRAYGDVEEKVTGLESQSKPDSETVKSRARSFERSLQASAEKDPHLSAEKISELKSKAEDAVFSYLKIAPTIDSAAKAQSAMDEFNEAIDALQVKRDAVISESNHQGEYKKIESFVKTIQKLSRDLERVKVSLSQLTAHEQQSEDGKAISSLISSATGEVAAISSALENKNTEYDYARGISLADTYISNAKTQYERIRIARAETPEASILPEAETGVSGQNTSVGADRLPDPYASRMAPQLRIPAKGRHTSRTLDDAFDSTFQNIDNAVGHAAGAEVAAKPKIETLSDFEQYIQENGGWANFSEELFNTFKDIEDAHLAFEKVLHRANAIVNGINELGPSALNVQDSMFQKELGDAFSKLGALDRTETNTPLHSLIERTMESAKELLRAEERVDAVLRPTISESQEASRVHPQGGGADVHTLPVGTDQLDDITQRIYDRAESQVASSGAATDGSAIDQAHVDKTANSRSNVDALNSWAGVPTGQIGDSTRRASSESSRNPDPVGNNESHASQNSFFTEAQRGISAGSSARTENEPNLSWSSAEKKGFSREVTEYNVEAQKLELNYLQSRVNKLNENFQENKRALTQLESNLAQLKNERDYESEQYKEKPIALASFAEKFQASIEVFKKQLEAIEQGEQVPDTAKEETGRTVKVKAESGKKGKENPTSLAAEAFKSNEKIEKQAKAETALADAYSAFDAFHVGSDPENPRYMTDPEFAIAKNITIIGESVGTLLTEVEDALQKSRGLLNKEAPSVDDLNQAYELVKSVPQRIADIQDRIAKSDPEKREEMRSQYNKTQNVLAGMDVLLGTIYNNLESSDALHNEVKDGKTFLEQSSDFNKEIGALYDRLKNGEIPIAAAFAEKLADKLNEFARSAEQYAPLSEEARQAIQNKLKKVRGQLDEDQKWRKVEKDPLTHRLLRGIDGDAVLMEEKGIFATFVDRGFKGEKKRYATLRGQWDALNKEIQEITEDIKTNPLSSPDARRERGEVLMDLVVQANALEGKINGIVGRITEHNNKALLILNGPHDVQTEQGVAKEKGIITTLQEKLTGENGVSRKLEDLRMLEDDIRPTLKKYEDDEKRLSAAIKESQKGITAIKNDPSLKQYQKTNAVFVLQASIDTARANLDTAQKKLPDLRKLAVSVEKQKKIFMENESYWNGKLDVYKKISNRFSVEGISLVEHFDIDANTTLASVDYVSSSYSGTADVGDQVIRRDSLSSEASDDAEDENGDSDQGVAKDQGTRATSNQERPQSWRINGEKFIERLNQGLDANGAYKTHVDEEAFFRAHPELKGDTDWKKLKEALIASRRDLSSMSAELDREAGLVA